MARARKAPRQWSRPLAVSAAALAFCGSLLVELPAAYAAPGPRGHDVSSHQKNVNWASVKSKGASFVYVKATESTNYRNSYFQQQYNGSRNAGMLHGAYHFALPQKSSGRTQAAYFLRHGGGGKADGWTLPPALDIESNPYDGKHKCYGLSRARMTAWISSFSAEVQRQTGRRPVIYTTARWWKSCTGNSTAFSAGHPLWLAHWGGSTGPMPGGWSYPTFWQHANRGRFPGDQNIFNGTPDALKRFAVN